MDFYVFLQQQCCWEAALYYCEKPCLYVIFWSSHIVFHSANNQRNDHVRMYGSFVYFAWCDGMRIPMYQNSYNIYSRTELQWHRSAVAVIIMNFFTNIFDYFFRLLIPLLKTSFQFHLTHFLIFN